MATLIKYSLEDFDIIAKRGFDYILSSEVLNKIAELSLEVGSPNYVKTPVFKKIEKNDNYVQKKRKHKTVEVITEDDWESLRTFQPTKIEEKAGLEKELDSIRSNLNKLSDKNYNNILTELVTIINTLLDDLDEEHKETVSSMIFEIASSNRFYSKIYATMYKELTEYYTWLLPYFNRKKESFKEVFDNVDYIEPNENYNRFCEINNENERRKAYSSFYINLFELNFIDFVFLEEIQKYITSKILNLISEENKKNHVDELVENICILIIKDKLSSQSEIYDIIDLLSQSKVKDYKSLTSKSIFKCMDILDV